MTRAHARPYILLKSVRKTTRQPRATRSVPCSAQGLEGLSGILTLRMVPTKAARAPIRPTVILETPHSFDYKPLKE
jgi:hypothetical protein